MKLTIASSGLFMALMNGVHGANVPVASTTTAIANFTVTSTFAQPSYSASATWYFNGTATVYPSPCYIPTAYPNPYPVTINGTASPSSYPTPVIVNGTASPTAVYASSSSHDGHENWGKPTATVTLTWSASSAYPYPSYAPSGVPFCPPYAGDNGTATFPIATSTFAGNGTIPTPSPTSSGNSTDGNSTAQNLNAGGNNTGFAVPTLEFSLSGAFIAALVGVASLM
ncbi:hypothetical protein CVT24_011319 [Panaeolus cyanescens]|uniref:Uncharacterized protein n=1 Tax=Panaeolus cyanescens TaxID=181874 RepID=A0A409YV02_9AGAR|nr:hypothetical protein CVT24_011319 [Panaeolus cyanescens]